MKTTPAVIKKVVHIGSQSQDIHANTQEATDAVITSLTTTIPNLTHITIGTYLDYGAASNATGGELDVVFPDGFVGTYLDYGGASGTDTSSTTTTGGELDVLFPDEFVGTYLDYDAGTTSTDTTPVNDQFTKWATSIHAAGKKMVIRSPGFNDWQGTNGVTQYTGTDFAENHRIKMVQWIQDNWAIFQSGDIFEPVPDEPESNSLWNATYGSITSGAGLAAFNTFIQAAISDAATIFAALGVTGVEVNHVTTTPSVAKDVISPYIATRLFAMSTDDLPEQSTDTTATACNTALQNELNASVVTSHQSKPKEVTLGPNTRTQLSDAVQSSAISQELVTVNTTLAGTLAGVTIWQFGATTNAPKSRLFDWNGTAWVPRSAASTVNNFFASMSGAGLRKGLTYEVQKPNSVTKTLKYEVITTPAGITKSLKYTVRRTPSALTKSLAYVIAPVVTLTKPLKYTVKTSQSAVTKSLKYCVRLTSGVFIDQQDVTAPNLGNVFGDTGVTNAGQSFTPSGSWNLYSVKVKLGWYSSVDPTDSVQLVVANTDGSGIPTTDIATSTNSCPSSSLTYASGSTGWTEVEFFFPAGTTLVGGTKYAFYAQRTGSLGAPYYALGDIGGTSVDELSVVFPDEFVGTYLDYETGIAGGGSTYAGGTYLQKASGNWTIAPSHDFYFIESYSIGSIFKSLRYTVSHSTASTITKSERYAVKVATTVTKSLQYIVQRLITKSVRYAVNVQVAKTKALKYTVPHTFAVTKSLKYEVRVAQAVLTKSLRYTVRATPSATTKSLQYYVAPALTLSKVLKYTVPHPYTKTLSLKYTVRAVAATKTKSLRYQVLTVPAQTLSLRYTVQPTSAITKSLKYTVKSNKLIIKPLAYRVLTVHNLTKSLTYAVQVTTGLTITKSLKYTVRTAPSAVTKQFAYRVITQHIITKSMSYRAAVLHTHTRSLTYTVRTTTTPITKSLRYEINPHPPGITLSLRYVVMPTRKIIKSLSYAVFVKTDRKKTVVRHRSQRLFMRNKGK